MQLSFHILLFHPSFILIYFALLNYILTILILIFKHLTVVLSKLINKLIEI